MSESLYDRTRRLLHESTQSLPDVHAGMKHRGSTVSYYWLRKFSRGEVRDPSVNRVQEVYEYLTGRSVLSK